MFYKKPTLFILFFFCFFFSPKTALSCTCIAPSSYCETINIQFNSSNLLVLAYKTSDTLHGMKLKVVQVLDGNESRDTITVWGGVGNLCRHYNSMFTTNDTLIFSLHNCNLMGNNGGPGPEQLDHYQISNCGIFYLNHNNGMVSGSIDNGVNYQSLNDFMILHNSCKSGTSSIEEHEINFQAYPNPTSEIITLKGINSLTEVSHIHLLDNKGALLKKIGINEKQIDLSSFSTGIYFVEIKHQLGTGRIKVVKQ